MAMRKFRLDRANGKLMGVCAGLGRMLGVDPTFVRIGVVVVTIMGLFPWTLIAYAAAAALARPGAFGRDEDDYGAMRTSTKDLRLKMRDIDHRMAEVESYVTSPNASLANEIEKLR